MVKAASFKNETEAHLAKDFLINRDIKAEILGAKEYTAHILGGGAGNFDLMVDPINVQLAQSLLAELQSPATSEPREPDHFRRAVFFAFVATIVLPIVFNYASIRNGILFWRKSKKDGLAIAKVVLIVVLQFMPIVVAYKVINWS
jgi:hypothetical protein